MTNYVILRSILTSLRQLMKSGGKKLTTEKLKIRLTKHLKPENCDQLFPTLVNMEIFSNIPTHNRSQNVKLQKMQKFLLKSAYPIVKKLDSILASSSSSNSSNKPPDQIFINKIKELASDGSAQSKQPRAVTIKARGYYEKLK